MKLKDYLAARGESESSFSRRCGIPLTSIRRIASGEGCNARSALFIERATNKLVGLEDLVDLSQPDEESEQGKPAEAAGGH